METKKINQVSKYLFKELLIDLFSIDDRYYLTMKTLLFSPWNLTIEFVDGDKGKYSSPTRIIFSIMTIYSFIFLILKISSINLDILQPGNIKNFDKLLFILPLVFLFITPLLIFPYLTIVFKEKEHNLIYSLIFSLHLCAYNLFCLCFLFPIAGEVFWAIYSIAFFNINLKSLISRNTNKWIIYILILFSVIPLFGKIFFITYIIIFFVLISRISNTKYNFISKLILVFTSILINVPIIGSIINSFNLILILSMIKIYNHDFNKLNSKYLLLLLINLIVIIIATFIVVRLSFGTLPGFLKIL